MPQEKNLEAGRRLASKFAKQIEARQSSKRILLSFNVDETVKKACLEKTSNLSAYLRRCMEKLAASDIERKVNKLYDDIIDETLEGR